MAVIIWGSEHSAELESRAVTAEAAATCSEGGTGERMQSLPCRGLTTRGKCYRLLSSSWHIGSAFCCCATAGLLRSDKAANSFCKAAPQDASSDTGSLGSLPSRTAGCKQGNENGRLHMEVYKGFFSNKGC